MGMLEDMEEEMKQDWRLRWLTRWECIKLDITEWWYWLRHKKENEDESRQV